ncbi:MAG: Hint domain-containing protein [Pseudomonadota bacterium]
MSATTIFSRAAFPTGPAEVGTAIRAPHPRFLPGTRVATPSGPQAIETLSNGDMLATRDGAMPIVRIGFDTTARADAALHREMWPIRVPVGSLGNPAPLRLRADQRVVLEGEQVLEACNVARVSVAVGDLLGLRGLMSERPLSDLRWFGLSLGGPALIRVEGALCEIDDGAAAVAARDCVRAAFAAMHAAGQPPLAVF